MIGSVTPAASSMVNHLHPHFASQPDPHHDVFPLCHSRSHCNRLSFSSSSPDADSGVDACDGFFSPTFGSTSSSASFPSSSSSTSSSSSVRYFMSSPFPGSLLDAPPPPPPPLQLLCSESL